MFVYVEPKSEKRRFFFFFHPKTNYHSSFVTPRAICRKMGFPTEKCIFLQKNAFFLQKNAFFLQKNPVFGGHMAGNRRKASGLKNFHKSFCKGGFCAIRCDSVTPKKTKNAQGCWTQQHIWHSAALRTHTSEIKGVHLHPLNFGVRLSGTESAILNRESGDSESCDSNRAIPMSL